MGSRRRATVTTAGTASRRRTGRARRGSRRVPVRHHQDNRGSRGSRPGAGSWLPRRPRRPRRSGTLSGERGRASSGSAIVPRRPSRRGRRRSEQARRRQVRRSGRQAADSLGGSSPTSRVSANLSLRVVRKVQREITPFRSMAPPLHQGRQARALLLEGPEGLSPRMVIRPSRTGPTPEEDPAATAAQADPAALRSRWVPSRRPPTPTKVDRRGRGRRLLRAPGEEQEGSLHRRAAGRGVHSRA
mmetsp:Transcript_21454/g.62771  ORF Transcript_21454/g.62771 Transcript_21454/m.62771 type:complete len:244 (+) Transcript_21454:1871-2602(+)